MYNENGIVFPCSSQLEVNPSTSNNHNEQYHSPRSVMPDPGDNPTDEGEGDSTLSKTLANFGDTFFYFWAN